LASWFCRVRKKTFYIKVSKYILSTHLNKEFIKKHKY
jgi:hypothetical protein